ncbi:MAG: T9SS type A sorting domain-containing protein, partial [Bacteroidales bacterium]
FSGIASAGSNYRKIKISNCMNTGNLSGSDKTAGIFCNLYTGNFALDEPMIIENCVNTGAISGNVSAGGITSGAGLNTTTPPIIRNNLNLGKTSNYALFDWSEQVAFETFENNFYDKQLVPQTASPQGDILENNAAKGLLTTDITGFALQEILGNGWSYAEGRYPIPLGLENHPAVQLAATPIYLPYEDQDNYNTVDSVTCHFTLGTENNVEWTSNPSQIELIQSENELKGVLQTTGFANLSAYLDGFTKNILLNIKSICQPDYKKEEIQKTQITAYPNPTKDILYFNQASAYEIFDLQGKLVMKSNKPQNFVNTAELKPGMYIIKIGEEVIKFVVE